MDKAADSVSHRTINSLSELIAIFPFTQSVGTVSGEKPFSLAQRTHTLGPITVLDLAFGADTWLKCAEERPYYQVNVVLTGRMEFLHRGSSISSSPGLATVWLPEGALIVPRWKAGSRIIAMRIKRDALENTLSDVVGHPVATQIDFGPSMAINEGAGRTWLHMFSVLARDVFRPGSALTQPLVASQYVESLTHALLHATEHQYRILLNDVQRNHHIASHIIRSAVDIIEAEPHLPLTVASLAGRCHISTRALEKGFVRYLGIPPITYLRQVRLQRAHQELLAADPSAETVTSIAKRWGYTNVGRFATAHTARYGETPATTLRRRNWTPSRVS